MTAKAGAMYVDSREGGAPSLVLVHGFGAHGHTWRRWLPHLHPTYRTHVVDLLGAGRSTVPRRGNYTPIAHARRLATWIQEQDDGPIVLVGHSLGAAVCMVTALLLRDEGAADRIQGLVLVSAAVYAQKLPPYLSLARVRILGDLLLLLSPPRWALRLGIRGIVGRPETVDREQVEGYRAPLCDFRRRRALLGTARQLDVELAHEVTARLDELPWPALLIWGAEDSVVPLRAGERLARDLRNAELVVLPEVGHLPPEEDPDGSIRPVLTFLERLRSS